MNVRSVFVLGRTGVGKSYFSSLIHQANGGAPNAFVHRAGDRSVTAEIKLMRMRGIEVADCPGFFDTDGFDGCNVCRLVKALEGATQIGAVVVMYQRWDRTVRMWYERIHEIMKGQNILLCRNFDPQTAVQEPNADPLQDPTEWSQDASVAHMTLGTGATSEDVQCFIPLFRAMETVSFEEDELVVPEMCYQGATQSRILSRVLTTDQRDVGKNIREWKEIGRSGRRYGFMGPREAIMGWVTRRVTHMKSFYNVQVYRETIRTRFDGTRDRKEEQLVVLAELEDPNPPLGSYTA